jgi:hypothetical protein
MLDSLSDQIDATKPAVLTGGASAWSPVSGFAGVGSVQIVDWRSGKVIPPAPAANFPRVGATASTTVEGDVLVFGGDLSANQGEEPAHVAELITGVGTTSPVAQNAVVMEGTAIPTAFHTATRLLDGSIAVVGGFKVAGVMAGMGGVAIDANDAYPLQRVVVSGGVLHLSVPAPSGFVGVGYHQATLLPDANALLVSGGNPTPVAGTQDDACKLHCSSKSAYLLDMGLTVRGQEMTPLKVSRYGHQQVLLGDGNALVTGGLRYEPASQDASTLVLDAIEVFNAHDASFDRANQPPILSGRPPGGEADHRNPALPRCITRDEYKKLFP